MFGLQPVLPGSVFSPSYLIKSCEHDTKMGAGKKEKEGEKQRERERALCVPQRSINTLKALNPKSITITLSPGQRICLLLFHKTTNRCNTGCLRRDLGIKPVWNFPINVRVKSAIYGRLSIGGLLRLQCCD